MSTKDEAIRVPEILPLIPLRDLILFPNLVVPLFVGRERSINALEEAMREDHLVALVTQRAAETQDPEPGEIYEIGCAVSILQELKLPDGTEGPRRGASADTDPRVSRAGSVPQGACRSRRGVGGGGHLSLIHISEPTRLRR